MRRAAADARFAAKASSPSLSLSLLLGSATPDRYCFVSAPPDNAAWVPPARALRFKTTPVRCCCGSSSEELPPSLSPSPRFAFFSFFCGQVNEFTCVSVETPRCVASPAHLFLFLSATTAPEQAAKQHVSRAARDTQPTRCRDARHVRIVARLLFLLFLRQAQEGCQSPLGRDRSGHSTASRVSPSSLTSPWAPSHPGHVSARARRRVSRGQRPRAENTQQRRWARREDAALSERRDCACTHLVGLVLLRHQPAQVCVRVRGDMSRVARLPSREAAWRAFSFFSFLAFFSPSSSKGGASGGAGSDTMATRAGRGEGLFCG